jgi:hypothetical protein
MPSSMDNTIHGKTGHGSAGQGNAALSASEARGYELRDANTGAVLGFLAFLAVVLAATLLGTWLVFRFFDYASREPNPGSAFGSVRQVPAGPLLQVNPRQDLLKTYAEEQALLEKYSWEDRKNGTVRLPIDRAMDLLLKKGVPVAAAAAEDKGTPETSAVGGLATEPAGDSANGSRGNQ